MKQDMQHKKVKRFENSNLVYVLDIEKSIKYGQGIKNI